MKWMRNQSVSLATDAAALRAFISRSSAVVVVSIGGLVLAGWIVGLEFLKGGTGDTVTVKANAAVLFMLIGAALLLLGPVEVARGRLTAGLACLTIVAVAALASLSEWLFSWDLHIDQILVSEAPGAVGTSDPGRMAATTALSFSLAAPALALLRLRDPRAGQLLVIAGASVTVAVIGAALFDLGTHRSTAESTNMPILAIATFSAVWVGLFSLRTDGLWTVVSSRRAALAAARVLVPTVISVPLWLGGLSLLGNNRDLFGDASSITMLAAASAVVVAGAIWATGSVYRSEMAAEKARETFAELVAASPDAVVARSVDGTLLIWNATAERLFGYTAAEAASQDPLFLVPPELRSQIVGEHDVPVGEGSREPWESVCIARDGGRIQVALSSFRLPGSGGYATVLRDTTEPKRREEALRASEARYRSLFKNIREGYAYCEVIFDSGSQAPDFRFLAVNDAFERLTGLQAVEGRWLTEVAPAVREQNPILFQTLARVAATGQPERLETHLPGVERWLSIAAYSVETGYFVAVLDDITERRTNEEEVRDRAETALRSAREQLQAIMDHAPAAIFVKDTSGHYVLVNRRYAALMGRPASEILGRTAHDLFPQAEADLKRQCELEILALATADEWEEIVSLPGGPQAFIASGLPLVGPSGHVEYVGYIYLDISERKRLEKEQQETKHALRDSLERLVALFGASPVPLLIIDDVTEVVSEVNQAFEALTGFHRDDMVGRTVDDVGLWGNPFDCSEMSSVLHRDGHVVNFETTVRTKSGEILHGLISVELVDAHGGNLRIVALIDITAQRHTAAALTAAIGVADRANEAKSEFISRMSHELRTPLSVIIGFAQVLRLDPLSPSEDEAVGHILNAGRHLLDLINDVLDISRLDSDIIGFPTEPVIVVPAIEDALALIRPLAEERQIATRFNLGEADPAMMAISDPQRLKQVMLNLLSNAVKYNRDGGSLTVTSTLTDGGEVRIQVADTGPGIGREKLHLLFQPFERLRAENTTVQGTGLGLALCKRLVEAMGGTIGAASTVGQGSVFWIDLPHAGDTQPTEPAASASAAAPLPIPAASLRPSTILYIEDNLANLDLVDRVLARFLKVELMPAGQGRIGIDLARMHRPDLIPP